MINSRKQSTKGIKEWKKCFWKIGINWWRLHKTVSWKLILSFFKEFSLVVFKTFYTLILVVKDCFVFFDCTTWFVGSWPGIKPGPTALGARRSLNHSTTGKSWELTLKGNSRPGFSEWAGGGMVSLEFLPRVRLLWWSDMGYWKLMRPHAPREPWPWIELGPHLADQAVTGWWVWWTQGEQGGSDDEEDKSSCCVQRERDWGNGNGGNTAFSGTKDQKAWGNHLLPNIISMNTMQHIITLMLMVQPWIFTGRTVAEALIPWPPDAKGWITGKDSDAGKDWRQKERRVEEDEMVRSHGHQPDGHEFEPTPGDSGNWGAWHAAVHGVAELDMT